MNYKLLPILMALVACQTVGNKALISDQREPASKQDEKFYFKSVTDQQREQMLEMASAFKASSVNVSSRQIQDILADTCGSEYKYEYNSETREYNWPVVTCQYKPDSDLTGMSAKFKCEFPDGKGGTDTRKIKYSQSSVNPKSSEVLEVFLGTSFAKLMGFPTGTYCPVQLICQDCPGSDPWKKNRSAAPAEVGSVHKFPYALVEFPEKGFEVNSRPPNPKPQGIAWEELRHVSGTDVEKKEKLIEREVWMMFIHFLRHNDADPHNQKLVCAKAKEVIGASDVEKKYECEKSYVYTSDYGLSFPKANMFIWDEPIAKQDGELCIGTLKKAWIGGAPGTGIILESSFSEEARQIFLQKIEQITDDQWREVFGLAQYGSLTDISIDNWIETAKSKIRKLKKINCPAFDSGKSVLGHN